VDPLISKWLPVGLAAAAIAFGAIDVQRYYDRLPPRFASHFDARGLPDGWSTKQQFVGMVIGTLALITATLVPLTLFVHVAPRILINLPNKEYWMAPNREAETRKVIARWGLWFAAATLWMLALVFHEVMVANLRQPPQVRSFWWLLGGYLAIVFLLVIQLVVRFSRKR
jgi:serine/threonine-protein kinase